MTILFGLLTAIAFGSSDFAAGLGGRSIGIGAVALIVQVVALVIAGIATVVFPGVGPTTNALLWGVFAGVGAAGGPLMLYRGLAVGQMSVVAPLSALVAAIVPALVGLVLGERLPFLSYVGLIMALPAIGLVSWQRTPAARRGGKSGAVEGLLGGGGFAMLFIGLGRADPGSGAWPLVFTLAVASLLVMPLAWRNRGDARPQRAALMLVAAGAIADGIGNVLFLAATRMGQLSIVAVLTSLYPAVTILLARFVLGERWNIAQWAGLLLAVVAVPLIAAG